MKNIAINSQRMAGWLMLNRFTKINEEADKRDNTRVVYLFKDTQKLRECMQNYNKFKEIIDDNANDKFDNQSEILKSISV